ncbi:MAG: ABC transporter permease subunit [Pseudotabrizicola sp.]|uniref:ABC transporter permease n=1 Tax=Pseudotabrizicola sp. TaxID=2939647 RepID=UPI0027234804|nr:ABC transporter permease subunit [Pseudotabrizicola sp.]MDO8882558.1 ABC transporter permease subunit [Pseudotabrizicola sp.]MDP2080376.1 ABC transporter permease subunit [Pseudotabrizicola sp.]MDZ7573780.1 ABC transporter permease subunit [Pseudotabrizicola sp.]
MPTADATPSPLRGKLPGLLLIAPALLAIALLYVVPLARSVIFAFLDQDGGLTTAHLRTAIELYGRDIVFTVLVALASLALISVVSIAIAGYLTLGATPWAVTALRWLYRWPLFIPFIVAGQTARSFLARNGLMNSLLIDSGLMDQATAQSLLDWRGLVLTFAWKQVPFVTLLLAGAMASVDRSTVEAARNMGAGRLRCLIEILLPQVRGTLLVGLILSLVTIMSVLSVPMMVIAGNPTMMTSMMAHRVTYYGDYAVANALGLFSYLITAVAAYAYLRMTLNQHNEGAR